MFLGGNAGLFAAQLLQGADDAETGVARLNDIVNVTFLCGLVRIGEEVLVLLLLFLEDFRSVLRILFHVLCV